LEKSQPAEVGKSWLESWLKLEKSQRMSSGIDPLRSVEQIKRVWLTRAGLSDEQN